MDQGPELGIRDADQDRAGRSRRRRCLPRGGGHQWGLVLMVVAVGVGYALYGSGAVHLQAQKERLNLEWLEARYLSSQLRLPA